MGLISTLLWIHVAHRTIKMQRDYRQEVVKHESELDPEERVYTNGKRFRAETSPPFLRITTSQHFACAFLVLWIIAWLVLIGKGILISN